MPPTRKRGRSNVRANYARVTSVGRMGRARIARAKYKKRKTLMSQVQTLARTIETKEGCRRVTNFQCSHNNLTVLNDADGNVFNPFICAQNVGDPMAAGGMNRVGDSITIKRLYFKFFVEGSLSRSKVYFRFMLIKMAKGDTLDRSTFFQNASGNKMIDMYNKERFTIIAQKTLTVYPPNNAATAVNGITGKAEGGAQGITGNRVFTMSMS